MTVESFLLRNKGMIAEVRLREECGGWSSSELAEVCSAIRQKDKSATMRSVRGKGRCYLAERGSGSSRELCHAAVLGGGADIRRGVGEGVASPSVCLTGSGVK